MKYSVEQVAEFNRMVCWDKDAITTSNKVAEFFGKRHDNVLRDIANLLKDIPEFSRLNFEESEYINSRGKKYTNYQITKDGFVMLAMGFTGKKAMEWKVKFINAFNWLVDQHHSMQIELDDFTKSDSISIANGSFHGRGLANRRKEKRELEVKRVELENKWQLKLC